MRRVIILAGIGVTAALSCLRPGKAEQAPATPAKPFVLFWCPNPQELKNATHVTPQVWAEGDPLSKQRYPDFPQAFWLERGITPLRAVGGYVNKDKSEDEFVEYWSNAQRRGYRGIAIDEFGRVAEQERMGPALVRTKRQCPALFIAVWHAGPLKEEHLPAYREAADVVMLETYASGTTGFEAKFERKTTSAREGGILHKTVMALGINDNANEESKKRHGRWANTSEELESQLRWLRQHAPEMPGVAFFASHASPKMVRTADDLAGRYFPRPARQLKPDGSTNHPPRP